MRERGKNLTAPPRPARGSAAVAGLTAEQIALARLAASWLLWYPDETLVARLPEIDRAVATLPSGPREPLAQFLAHLDGTPLVDVQRHYVSIFDMKRKACPYLSYWTDGDTRNRGVAILRFKQAYLESGFDLGDEELADHLAVVLEFAAVGDPSTGEALLAEHAAPIGLLREALADLDSVYVHVLDAVLATMGEITPEVAARMVELAGSGPPVEQVGLEPFGRGPVLVELGARR